MQLKVLKITCEVSVLQYMVDMLFIGLLLEGFSVSVLWINDLGAKEVAQLFRVNEMWLNYEVFA